MIPLESWDEVSSGDKIVQCITIEWYCSLCQGVCFRHQAGSIFTFRERKDSGGSLTDERNHIYEDVQAYYFSRTEEVAAQPLSNASSRTLCPSCSTPLKFKALSDWCPKCDRIYGG